MDRSAKEDGESRVGAYVFEKVYNKGSKQDLGGKKANDEMVSFFATVLRSSLLAATHTYAHSCEIRRDAPHLTWTQSSTDCRQSLTSAMSI